VAGLKVITQPIVEPVSLEELKQQLRIEADDTSLDDTLLPLIKASREWCEGFQNRAYITQTLELALDSWPTGAIELPRPPYQSMVSVSYTNEDNVTTIWSSANYVVDDYAFVPRWLKKRNVNFPSDVLADVNAIKIRYVVGSAPIDGEAAEVPEHVKQAIILYAMAMFDSPGCNPPEAVKTLLWLDRVVPL
jgi:uncharacterized phiE125 gp8 family phage protein